MFFKEKKKEKVNYNDYWKQDVSIKKVAKRVDYFFPLCKDKSVLHFGCTDYPIFNPLNNLHIQLSSLTQKLHGFDIDIKGIEELKKHVDQPYFSNFEELKFNKYDVCLIPETIEHVDNIQLFLQSLQFVNADTFIITGPNCFAPEHMIRNTFENGVYTEIIHPDHNCWFSPFTLKNVVEKYAPLKVKQVYLLEDERMVCCEATKK